MILKTIVIDSNCLFAALIRDSIARKIIMNPRIEFIAPDFLFVEIQNHKKTILKKSKLTETEFQIVYDEIYKRINIIPYEEILPCYDKAKSIMATIDPKDSVFLAVTMCTDNNGIWSEDKGFDKQKVVKVWKTIELMNLLKIKP